MSQMMSYLYVLCTILLTVYGQIVIKWQVNIAGEMPAEISEKLHFLMKLVLNPFVLSGLAAGLVASITWMAAMTKLQLSHAYPFMSLAFVLVIICSSIFFNEPITTPKVIGTALVIFGLAIGSQG